MPSIYPLFYRLGFTPWTARTENPMLDRMLAELPTGRALDLGCGTGGDVIAMAQHGWDAVGVDGVTQPLRTARERAAAAGVSADFRRGDVTRLGEVVPGETFDLVHDAGCFHGLGENQRYACAAGINAATKPGAHLLLLAAMPRRGIGPHGLDADDLLRYLGPDWTLEDSVDVGATAPRGPLKGVHFVWYPLRR
jgi:SAM-dependent methyltransferase